MVVILDYDMGNVGAIRNILHKVGEKDVVTSRDASVIRNADKMIIPGVGAFDGGMHNLKTYDLVDVIKEFANIDKKPILGICLGMQLLGRGSEEGQEKGLGLIPFDNYKFRLDPQYKVPHMGWDYVKIESKECPLVKGLDDEQRYYFVHSYYAKCDDEANVMMTCEYGHKFAAAVVKDNILGVQFHPEKSHQFGMLLLKNFLEEYKIAE